MAGVELRAGRVNTWAAIEQVREQVDSLRTLRADHPQVFAARAIIVIGDLERTGARLADQARGWDGHTLPKPDHTAASLEIRDRYFGPRDTLVRDILDIYAHQEESEAPRTDVRLTLIPEKPGFARVEAVDIAVGGHPLSGRDIMISRFDPQRQILRLIQEHDHRMDMVGGSLNLIRQRLWGEVADEEFAVRAVTELRTLHDIHRSIAQGGNGRRPNSKTTDVSTLWSVQKSLLHLLFAQEINGTIPGVRLVVKDPPASTPYYLELSTSSTTVPVALHDIRPGEPDEQRELLVRVLKANQARDEQV